MLVWAEEISSFSIFPLYYYKSKYYNIKSLLSPFSLLLPFFPLFIPAFPLAELFSSFRLWHRMFFCNTAGFRVWWTVALSQTRWVQSWVEQRNLLGVYECIRGIQGSVLRWYSGTARLENHWPEKHRVLFEAVEWGWTGIPYGALQKVLDANLAKNCDRTGWFVWGLEFRAPDYPLSVRHPPAEISEKSELLGPLPVGV